MFVLVINVKLNQIAMLTINSRKQRKITEDLESCSERNKKLKFLEEHVYIFQVAMDSNP